MHTAIFRGKQPNRRNGKKTLRSANLKQNVKFLQRHIFVNERPTAYSHL